MSFTPESFSWPHFLLQLNHVPSQSAYLPESNQNHFWNSFWFCSGIWVPAGQRSSLTLSSLAPSAQPRTVEQQMSVEWLCGRIGTKEDQRIPNEELRKWLKGVKLEKKFSRNAKPFLREAGTRIMIMTSILIKVSKIEHCPTVRVNLLSWALGCPVYHPRPAGRPAWKVDALF